MITESHAHKYNAARLETNHFDFIVEYEYIFFSKYLYQLTLKCQVA